MIDFKIGTSALQAFQTVMQTIGHNIANANTSGYNRQEVKLISSKPDITPYGIRGTGVEVGTIRRVKEEYIDLQIQKENRELGKWQVREDNLEQLELYFNEPSESGLSYLMSEFWNSWQNLANDPESYTSRAVLIQQSLTLTNTINNIDSKIDQLRLDIDNIIRTRVDEINNFATQIASLNSEISSYETGGKIANDLRDQRDYLVNQLSKIINVITHELSNGSLAISISGKSLVWHTDTTHIIVEPNTSSSLNLVDVKWEDTREIISPSNGELNGLLYSRDTIIPSYKAKLDLLANRMIEEVNRVHTSGIGLTGFTSLVADNDVDDINADLNDSTSTGLAYTPVTGSFEINVKEESTGNIVTTTVDVLDGVTDSLQDLSDYININVANVSSSIINGRLTLTADSGYTFTFTNDTSDVLLALGLNTFFSGNDASNITVNSVIQNDPSLIAAATTHNPGDNSNALSIASLKDTLTMSNSTATFDDFYQSDIIGAIGMDVKEASMMVDTQELVLEQLNNRRDEVSGVSLDEEITLLIQFQHAYEAAAKYLDIVGQMLDTLMNSV